MLYSEFKITYNLKRLGQNSTSGENEVNLPTIKRIVSSFSIPDTMRFSDLRGFFLSLFLILAFLNPLQLIKSQKKKMTNHLLKNYEFLVFFFLTSKKSKSTKGSEESKCCKVSIRFCTCVWQLCFIRCFRRCCTIYCLF